MDSSGFYRRLALTVCGLLLGATELLGMQSNSATQHDHHMAEVKERGAESMGFDQDKTAHHFFLREDGGVITVRAKDPKDAASIGQIQHHLRLQAETFSRGEFDAPEHTHGQVPPGVPSMERPRDEIRYEFRKTPQGGEIEDFIQPPHGSRSDPPVFESD